MSRSIFRFRHSGRLREDASGTSCLSPGVDIFVSSPLLSLEDVLKNLEKQGSQLVMYLHPWELDPEQPRMDGPVLSKVRHYLNLGKTEQRLRWLLSDFSFAPINEVVCPIRDSSEGQGRVFSRNRVKSGPSL